MCNQKHGFFARMITGSILGPPTKPNTVGLAGKRTSDEVIELSASAGSERYEIREDERR